MRLLFSLALWTQLLAAAPISIDFDGFADSDILTTQISDLTFANAIVLSSGISLNEFEFPPRSGNNVASDNGGPITITFATPVSSFSGYFTYTSGLTLQAFDTSNALLGTTASTFISNLALSGDIGSAPNELLALAFPNIASVVITGDPPGNSFTLDDLTYDSAVPEPSTAVLILLTATAALLRRQNSRH